MKIKDLILILQIYNPDNEILVRTKSGAREVYKVEYENGSREVFISPKDDGLS